MLRCFGKKTISNFTLLLVAAGLIAACETVDTGGTRTGQAPVYEPADPEYEPPTEYDEEETYRIVGIYQADPSKGFISNESPIGRALLGKKKGAKVKVETPGGEAEFKIKAIE